MKTDKAVAVASTQLPAAFTYDSDDVGAGFEDVGRDEFLIPFLRVLQPMSPQVMPVQAGGLKDAKAGQIFNGATNELFDGEEGIDFIPCSRAHNYVEFINRDEGGGFVTARAVDDPLVVTLQREQGAFGKLKTPDGHDLIETFYLYGIVLPKGQAPARVVIGFTSSQIKKYKMFVTRALGIKYPDATGMLRNPPIYGHAWHLSTTFEQNAQGSWYGWRLEPATEDVAEARLAVSDQRFQEAKTFYKMLAEGAVKADYAKARDAVAAEETEIPF